jgi:hypothetical protein
MNRKNVRQTGFVDKLLCTRLANNFDSDASGSSLPAKHLWKCFKFEAEESLELRYFLDSISEI